MTINKNSTSRLKTMFNKYEFKKLNNIFLKITSWLITMFDKQNSTTYVLKILN